MRRSVSRAGLSPTAASDQMLVKFVAMGVRRMQASNALELEDKIQLAEINIRRIVQIMAKAAMTSGTFPVIDQDAFLDAQRKLCPAWPFC
jgi:hypothetical protein